MFDVFKQKRTVVGLDIGRVSVKLLSLREEDGKITVLKAKRIPIDQTNRESDLPKALLKAFYGVSLKGARLVSVITDPRNVLRKLTVPQMPISELRDALLWELKDQIPFEKEEAALDFEIVREMVEKGAKKYEILVAVSPKEAIQEHLRLLKRVEATPSRLIQGPTALQSLFRKFTSTFNEPAAILVMGHAVTELSIYRAGNLEFSRMLPVSGEDFTKALMVPIRSEQGTIALKREEAERVKQEYGLSQASSTEREISPSQILPLVRPVAERLSSEIERSLIFYQEQSSGGRINRLLLFGGGTSLSGLDRFLSESLGIDVTTQDPFGELPLRGTPEKIVQEAPLEFALALGAALSGEEGINLLPQEVKEQTKRLIQRSAFKGTATALLLLLVFFYAGMQIEATNRAKKIAVARLELSALTPFLEEAKQKIVLGRLFNKEPYWEDLFRELSHLLPEEGYLKRLKFEEGKVTLEGILATEAGNSEELLSKMIFAMEQGIFQKVSLVEAKKAEEGNESSFEIRAELD